MENPKGTVNSEYQRRNWGNFVEPQFSPSVMSNFLRPHGLQHARPPCPSLTPRAYSNSRPSRWWWHPTILSSVIPFSSCLQSFPTLGSFPMSQFFISSGQNIGVSASASVLPMNIDDLSPLGWTGWISLQCKELSRVFSNTTVQKHLLFRLSFLYGPTLTYIHDYWKTIALTRWTFVGKVMSLLLNMLLRLVIDLPQKNSKSFSENILFRIYKKNTTLYWVSLITKKYIN